MPCCGVGSPGAGGPLTIGEAAAHLRRTQSVVSEIVNHQEPEGLVERESDPADRRRTLVWLTAAGQTAMRRQRDVLSGELLVAALRRMPRTGGRAARRAPRARTVRYSAPAAAGTSEVNPS